MRLATAGAFREDPAGVWEWYEDRRRNAREAEPNAGHRAVAALERHYEVDVLTQNVDGLHQRAGSTRVTELHGNISRTRCDSCGRPGGDGAFAELPPRCGACGGLLRPDVVWFGEALPAAAWAAAERAAAACDVMVVAGTSLEVSPANTLPHAAARAGAALAEVNPEETPLAHVADASVRGPASAALSELLRLAGSLRA